MADLFLTIQPPVGPASASKLGRFLGAYDISTRGLRTLQCVGDGYCEVDNATAETIKMVASSTASAVVTTPITSPVTVPITYALLIILGNWLVPVLIAMLAGAIGLQHWYDRKFGKMVNDPDTGKEVFPHYTMVEFDFSDVGPKRRKWAEYLLALFALQNNGKLSGLRYPAVEADAERAVAKYGAGYYPQPWKHQPAGYVRRGSRRRRARRFFKI